MPDKLIGNICDDKGLIEQGVHIWLSAGSRSWQGSFAVPHGSKVSITGAGKYHLELEDGRRGVILITGYKPTAAGVEVTFQGTGALV